MEVLSSKKDTSTSIEDASSFLLQDLIQKSMQFCYARPSSKIDRRQLFEELACIIKQIRKNLLNISHEQTEEEEEDPIAMNLAPPSAFFKFEPHGKLHLPIIDWASFRGFSIAIWINLDLCFQNKEDQPTHNPQGNVIAEQEQAKFFLYRFTNTSDTLGVEACLLCARSNPKVITLRVGSCITGGSGGSSGDSRSGSSSSGSSSSKLSKKIASSSTTKNDWKYVQSRVNIQPGKWQLVVISHSLPYVKKSKVSCYVDASLQFQEELVYPTGLVNASKCIVGNGSNMSAKVANVSMFQEELTRQSIAMLYTQGPSVACFNRWIGIPKSTTDDFFADLNEPGAPPPLTMYASCMDTLLGLNKLNVIFNFTAYDDTHEKYEDLGVEWLREGTISSSKGSGKWLTLEQISSNNANTATSSASSSEIQQRHARLGKSVHKIILPNACASWYRKIGVASLPVLLHYMLGGYEAMVHLDMTPDDTKMEEILMDFMMILKGLLLNNIMLQEEFLKSFGFHLLSHVFLLHEKHLTKFLTPAAVIVCVELIRSIRVMREAFETSMLSASTYSSSSSNDPEKDGQTGATGTGNGGVVDFSASSKGLNHPFLEENIWLLNPLFASSVRGFLLDFRIWKQVSFKTQSIFCHQLYSLACEYPKALNDVHVVTRVLDVLRHYYSTSNRTGNSSTTAATTNSPPSSPRGSPTTGNGQRRGRLPSSPRSSPTTHAISGSISSQNSQQFKEDERYRHWKQQCIHSLVELMEVCLRNQSVFVQQVNEKERMEFFSNEILHGPSGSSSTNATLAAAGIGGGTVGSGTSGSNGNGIASSASAGAGGAGNFQRNSRVFTINLETIIWSDQGAAGDDLGANEEEFHHHREKKKQLQQHQHHQHSKHIEEDKSVLPHVQVRTSLVRDIRAILRFLLSCEDLELCTAVLGLLRRLAVSFLDVRFALISSGGFDCLLFLLQRCSSKFGAIPESNTSSSLRVLMACLGLLVFLMDWLESIEGRTVWCGIDEHLRMMWSGESGSVFPAAYVDWMTEFYFDPIYLLGAHQSIVMNDLSKARESPLFPISAGSNGLGSQAEAASVAIAAATGLGASSNTTAAGLTGTSTSAVVTPNASAAALGSGSSMFHEDHEDLSNHSGLESSASVAGGVNRGSGSGPVAAGGEAWSSWMKSMSQAFGHRLALSWEKRLAIIRMSALKSLDTLEAQDLEEESISHNHNGLHTEENIHLIEEGVSSLLHLPLKTVLPFLPVFLNHSSSAFREKILMEVSVMLKSDFVLQNQLLWMKKDWSEHFLKLSLACTRPLQSESLSMSEKSEASTSSTTASLHTTGEDLVLDMMVCLLSNAMNQTRGWRSFSDVILSLKLLKKRRQYQALTLSVSKKRSMHVSSNQKDLWHHTFDWLSRLIGIVLLRIARSRTILSKVLAENLRKVLCLVSETLLCPGLKQQEAIWSRTWDETPSTTSTSWIWTSASTYLLTAVIDIGQMLVESTHKHHRVGLGLSLQILNQVLPHVPTTFVPRIVTLLEHALQQEVMQVAAIRIYEGMALRDVLLGTLVCLRRALLLHKSPGTDGQVDGEKLRAIVRLRQLTLRIATTSGIFGTELHTNGLTKPVLEVMNEQEAVVAVLNALAVPINDVEMQEKEEENDLVPLFPLAKEIVTSFVSVEGGETSVGSSNGQESTRDNVQDREREPAATTTIVKAFTRTRSESTSPLSPQEEQERLLLAAMEVEATRMGKVLVEISVRDNQRAEYEVQAKLMTKNQWSRHLWLTREYCFRSQHQTHAFDTFPEISKRLHHRLEYRISLHETPPPGRIRRMVQVDIDSTEVTSLDMLSAFAWGTIDGKEAVEGKEEEDHTEDASTSTKEAKHFKRQFSIDLGSPTLQPHFIHQTSISSINTNGDTTSPSALMSPLRLSSSNHETTGFYSPSRRGSTVSLLNMEEVGRAVAEQAATVSKKEIQDITQSKPEDEEEEEEDGEGNVEGKTEDKIEKQDDVVLTQEHEKVEGETPLQIQASQDSAADNTKQDNASEDTAVSTVASSSPPAIDTEMVMSRDRSLSSSSSTSVTTQLSPSPTIQEGVPTMGSGGISGTNTKVGNTQASSFVSLASLYRPRLDILDSRFEKSLDPSAGLGLLATDRIYARASKCRQVVPMGHVYGKLYICHQALVFEPLSSQTLDPKAYEETASGLHPCWRFKYQHFVAVYLRRYRLRDSGMEIFVRNGRNFFLDFPGFSKQKRNEMIRLLYSLLPKHVLKQWPGKHHHHHNNQQQTNTKSMDEMAQGDPNHMAGGGNTEANLAGSNASTSAGGGVGGGGGGLSSLFGYPGGGGIGGRSGIGFGFGGTASLSSLTKAWQHHRISNFEYLMMLNTFAGRSFNDLTQYPIFPWVLDDYTSDSIDLSNPKTFRDLSKPMGALNPERLEEYWERYHAFEDPLIPKFLYGSHYSTCAGVVLYFLFRLQPFAGLHVRMQNGSFDLPDRLFHSINETWKMCHSQMQEVKELIPEFYSNPLFLENLNQFDFGKRLSDQSRVSCVKLPPWAAESPQQFIQMHRQALESDFVSSQLHLWIDLIFGFKQRGPEALKANNVFYYLTYYGVVDLETIEDPFLKEAMEQQIAHFGQCPMQLFTSAHPKRYTRQHSSVLSATSTGRLNATAAATIVKRKKTIEAAAKRSKKAVQSAAAAAVAVVAAGGGGASHNSGPPREGDLDGTTSLPPTRSRTSTSTEVTAAEGDSADQSSYSESIDPESSGTKAITAAPPPVPNATSATSTTGVATTNAPRSLAFAFEDVSLTAQQDRNRWETFVVKPLGKCEIKLIKILPDRFLTVNELGVIEMYFWKLVPKPVESMPATGAAAAVPSLATTHGKGTGLVEINPNAQSNAGGLAATTPTDVTPKSLQTPSSVGDLDNGDAADGDFTRVSMSEAFSSAPTTPTVRATSTTTSSSSTTTATSTSSNCAWRVEVIRDDSPFDFVPRVPVFEDMSTGAFPLAISSNRRILVSGGARNGAIHLRLLDLDNGHVIGKGTIMGGHDQAVTCLYLHPMVYTSEELLLSGSKDGSLALWRVSRVNDMFRMPRVSSVPLMLLRGHMESIVDAVVDVSVGIAVSCTKTMGLVHYLHAGGQVAFDFRPFDFTTMTCTSRLNGSFSKVRISTQGFLLVLTTYRDATKKKSDEQQSTLGQVVVGTEEVPVVQVEEQSHNDDDEEDEDEEVTWGSVVDVYNVSGTLVHREYLHEVGCSNIQLSDEGDMVILTLVSLGIIRICRLEDFMIVQEYTLPSNVTSSISTVSFGPSEAVVLAASGHSDGTVTLRLLPDADGSVSFLSSLRRFLGVSSKLKIVKGTVQQAQHLAMSTFGSAKAVTTTARDIAGEAIGEAKSLVKGIFSYLSK